MISKLFGQNKRVLGVLMIAATLMACSSTPEQKRAKFLAQGKKNFAEKNYNAAILDFRNALASIPSDKMGPADAETLYQLGVAFLASGSFNDGVVSLLQAADLDPKHAPTQVKLAELMSTSQEKSVLLEAAKRAKDAVALAPDSPEALHALAMAELKLGDPQDAEKHLMEALSRAPQDMVAALSLARLKVANREVAEAETIVLAAAEKSPNSASVAQVVGQFYMMIGKAPEAEVQFKKAVQIEPENGAALFALATLQHRTGQLPQADETFKRLAALPGTTYRAMHAMFLFDKGDKDGAIREMEAVVSKDPKDLVSRSRLLQLFEVTGRWGDAERVLAEALKRNPKDLDALEGRAKLFVARQQFAEAQKDILQIVSLSPDSAPAHYLLARVYRALGQVQYRQELDLALTLDPTLLDARIGIVESLRAQRTPQNALELLDAAPVFQKRSARFVEVRNSILMDMGKENEVRDGVEAGLKAARTPQLLLQDALLKLRHQNFDAARVSLHEALRADPENVRLLETLADSYLAQNAEKRSIDAIRQLAMARPKSAFLQQFLGARLLRAGDPKGARAALHAALDVNPNLPAATVELARLDIIEGNSEQASQSLSKILSEDGSNIVARLLMGQIEDQKGKYAAAAEQYRSILKVDPQNLLAMNNLSYLLVEHLGKTDEGLQLAQKVVQVAPNFVAAQDTLGWAFYHKGMQDTALQYLEKAAIADAKSGLVRYHLAMALHKSGNNGKARTEFEAAVRLDPKLNTSEAREALGVAR